jgi:hypothetical protein
VCTWHAATRVGCTCLTKYMAIADQTLPLAPTDWHIWSNQAIWVGEDDMRGQGLQIWPKLLKFGGIGPVRD